MPEVTSSSAPSMASVAPGAIIGAVVAVMVVLVVVPVIVSAVLIAWKVSTREKKSFTSK